MKEKQTAIPTGFTDRIQSLLASEAGELLEALQSRSVAGLRVNTLKISADEFKDRSPFALEPMPVPGGFRLSPTSNPGKHPYHAAGLYYLQDPAAMAAAWLLAPQPGERVLDLSAAPGGKTTHLAALMENRGLLVANEIDRQRAWDLVENLERMGVRNAVVTNEHPERLGEFFEGYFDRVLLDSPCSGEGMFARSDAARVQWSPAFVQSCAARQKHIIRSAAKMVRRGGRLAYVTCAFSPEENEGVVADFLKENKDFRLLEVPRVEGFSPGRPDWSSGEYFLESLDRTVRLWPHRWPGGGHFIAIMERSGGGLETDLYGMKTPRFWADTEQAIVVFAAAAWFKMPELGELALFGDELCALPEEKPDLRSLSVLRYGLKMGEILKGRFEPAHALALGVDFDLVRNRENFEANSARLQAYLRGDPFESAGAPGWLAVGVDGFSIGWGKRVGDVVKNHYPRTLRQA